MACPSVRNAWLPLRWLLGTVMIMLVLSSGVLVQSDRSVEGHITPHGRSVFVFAEASASVWDDEDVTGALTREGSVSTSGNVTMKVVKRVAPDGYTRSITFLSSGYLEEDEELFDSDVKTSVTVLFNYSSGINADPWPRYAEQVNLYSVFQPSLEEGFLSLEAEDALGNNLECREGKTEFFEIACSVPKIASLASYAPAQDVVLVLVKADHATGTGGNGIAVVSNQPEYLPVLTVHYLNRAFANLAEEYSEGYSGSCRSNAMPPNCASSKEEAKARWGYWLEQLEQNSSVSVLGSGCTFSNYIAPTSNACLMRSSKYNYMCPVCRETLNLAFFEKGVQHSYALEPSTSPITLSAGQCPPAHHSIVAADGETIVLYAGDFALKNSVSVEWRNAAGEVLGSGIYYNPSVADLGTLPANISAVITDTSPYVQPSKRQPLQSVTTFYIVAAAPAGVTASTPSCYSALNDPPATPTATSFCTEGLVCLDKAPSIEGVPPIKGEVFQLPPMRSMDLVLPMVAAGGGSILLWLAITISFFAYFRRAPREVLDVTVLDRLLVMLISALVAGMWVFSICAVGVANQRRKREITVYFPVCLVTMILCSVTMALAAYNYLAVLLRWYWSCAISAVLSASLGVALFVFGVFAILASAGSSSQQFQDLLHKRWQRAVSGEESFVCPFQRAYDCSGYFTSCFQLNSSVCSLSCDANFYMDSCGPHFTDIFEVQYSPIDALIIVVSCLLVIISALDTLYYMRYRQISSSGAFCRKFRRDPHPPVLPITFTEARRARRSFDFAARKSGKKLPSDKAIKFLEMVFTDPITNEEKEVIQQAQSLSFDELMLIYFPHTQTSKMDPRMLTPDEAELTFDMLQLERKQFRKLEEFEEAAGCLSPEALHKIFQEKFSTVFMPDKEEILKAVEAEAHNCPEAAMCRGLSRTELEGLRGLWVAVNPSIVGPLDDDALRAFYEYSHPGHTCAPGAQLEKWKKDLDVLERGEIGWGEFCYPYAQRALLEDARSYLRSVESDLPPEMLSREFVMEKYGNGLASCFLPNEKMIPIERVVVTVMRRWSDNPLHEKKLFEANLYHNTVLHHTEEEKRKKSD